MLTWFCFKRKLTVHVGSGTHILFFFYSNVHARQRIAQPVNYFTVYLFLISIFMANAVKSYSIIIYVISKSGRLKYTVEYVCQRLVLSCYVNRRYTFNLLIIIHEIQICLMMQSIEEFFDRSLF